MKNSIILLYLSTIIVFNSCNSQNRIPKITNNKPMKELKLKPILFSTHEYRISIVNGKLFDIKEEDFLMDGLYTIYVDNCVAQPSDIVGDYDVSKKGMIKNGKYQKKWIYYSSENKIVKEENFDNDGFLTGNFIIHNNRNELLYKAKFINGTGYFKDYCFRTSEIKEEGNMINGKKEGEWKVYFLDSTSLKFKIENYKNGELVISNK